MIHIFEKIAEQKIKEAMESGELDNLPGRGAPIDLSEYFKAPEESRAAYALLQSSGHLPREVSLKVEICALQQELSRCDDEQKQRELRAAIEEKNITLSILLERYRKR